MPKCKNDPKKSYKGTEPSPKGLGYCAHGEKEGKIRKGKDGNKWIVKKIKSGSLRWIKHIKKKSKSIKKAKTVFRKEKIYTKWFRDLSASQKKTYKTLTTKTKSELQKVGINVFIYPLYQSESGYYIIDHAWDYAYDYFENSAIEDEPFIIIVLKINDNKLYLPRDKSLQIQHSDIKHSNKKNLINIFKKTLGKNYKWNGKISQTISVKL